MTTLFSGIDAKLERAAQLIEQVAKEESDFLGKSPPPVRAVSSHSSDGRELRLDAFADSAPPVRFSVLAGEVVHHLRSALDHVIWALATQNVGTPASKIQFPIYEKKADFEKALERGIVSGVGVAAIEVIRSLQPFTAKDSDDTVLAVLAKLDNVDKHRLLVVTTTAAQLGEELVFENNPDVVVSKGDNIAVTKIDVPNFVNVKPGGSRVGTVTCADPAFGLRFRSDLEVKVAFEKLGRVAAMPVVRGLTLLHEGVVNSIARFRPLIK